MKKIVNLIIIATFFAALSNLFSSCAPTENAPFDTTLGAAPTSIALTRADSSQSSAISLSCGCPFGPSDTYGNTVAPPLAAVGYGDTSDILFSFPHPLDSEAYFHTVYATISPSALKSSGTASSWVIFYFLDQGQYPLYDTLRVTATY